jgi:hypothetical protein
MSRSKVPKGRHNVAHHFNGGRVNVPIQSPVGATQMVEHLCRPYGALYLCVCFPTVENGGLRCAVPPGLGDARDRFFLLLNKPD